MNIARYLEAQGYTPYRWVYGDLIKCDRPHEFTTVKAGGLDVRWVKDRRVFVYGLSEKGKPPTLISPRMFQMDDDQNKYLASKPIEKIYNELKNLLY